jgi:L-lactate utilization protein LutC
MEPTENPGRGRILERLRTALRAPAPRHPSAEGRAIFAPVTNALERFQEECADNDTECVVTPDLGASAAAVADVLAGLPPGEIFIQDAPPLRSMAPMWQGGRSVRWSSEGGPSEGSQATITLAESLVAATGSIFVSAACGGRGASVVAPVHIVLAGMEQLVPDLDTAFARVRELGTASQNSVLCLITGSSRTADIEKILVLGAHGPRRLVVVLALSFEFGAGLSWRADRAFS